MSSPVSISPNKYASLVVEGVDTQCTTDCVDTTASSVSFASTVPSTGVPIERWWSAQGLACRKERVGDL